jgi:3-phosphoshikimate 1-carboxyvinyltransferase
MSSLTLPTLTKPFVADFTPPGSKSLTNRALILAALSKGVCNLSNCLFADDTLVMIEALQRLGFGLDVDRAGSSIAVHGQSGAIPSSSADLFCGNSGTSIRFLAALCTLGKSARYTLDGIPRMRQRPIGQLVDLLRNYGARINYLGEAGFPPIEVLADSLAGGINRFASAQSSQFLSALLQVCPCARHECKIDLEPPVTSWPYVAMTMQLMDRFGATPELLRDPMGNPVQIVVERGGYRATDYTVEPDASNASYFLAAAALHKGSKLTLHGLGKSSLQGDVGFADVLHRMGAPLIFGRDFITMMGADRLEPIDVDLSDMPDTAQTLAVVALFAGGPSTIRGLHTLRLKETDRIAALATELRKLGGDVDVEGDDAITISPPEDPRGLRPASIATYDDHRMAMSFALAATRIAGVAIEDPQCVNKTYPHYFDDLRRVLGL